MKILHNHIGYEASAHKHAVAVGSASEQVLSFRILDCSSGQELFSGNPKWVGPVQNRKDWHFWTLDFDSVQVEGTYCLECTTHQGAARSFPFLIQTDLLAQTTLSDVLYYFKAQRCSGPLDNADRHLTFEGDTSGRTVDAHGGWYDATGDLGKHLSHLCFSTFFNPQQTPMVVWSLFKSFEALRDKHSVHFKQYLKRLLDEAIYGADYLVRLKAPHGSFYIRVSAHGPEKKPEDRRLGRVMQGFEPTALEKLSSPSAQSIPEHHYQSSYRSGAGVAIAALAIASTHHLSGDYTSKDYLKSALDAFSYLETHNLEVINDGKENIVDDYCALLAATELYKATRNEVHKAAADKRAASLANRLVESDEHNHYWRADDTDRPFFHAADGGLPVVSLLNYLDIASSAQKQTVLDAVRGSMMHELEITAEVNNPFGYSRQFVQDKTGQRRTSFFFPHNTEVSPWWQGENARLASMATAAQMSARYFGQDREFCDQLQAFGCNQLNWILGLNPYDMCMLDGSGHNNPQYVSCGGSYQYSNCPGGICNGITSGIADEEDILFPGPADPVSQEDNWRWAEQWLPHAAWYLLAVSSA